MFSERRMAKMAKWQECHFAIYAIFAILPIPARMAGMASCHFCNVLPFLPFFAIPAIPAIFAIIALLHAMTVHHRNSIYTLRTSNVADIGNVTPLLAWVFRKHPSPRIAPIPSNRTSLPNFAPQTTPSNRTSLPGPCIYTVAVHYRNSVYTIRTSNVADIENSTPLLAWVFWKHPSTRIAHHSPNFAPQTTPSNRTSLPGPCIYTVAVHYRNSIYTLRTSNVADIENPTPLLAWVFWKHPSPRIAPLPSNRTSLPELRTSNLTLESHIPAWTVHIHCSCTL